LAMFCILVPLILKAICSRYPDRITAVSAVHDAGKTTIDMNIRFECSMVVHCLRSGRLTVLQILGHNPQGALMARWARPPKRFPQSEISLPLVTCESHGWNLL